MQISVGIAVCNHANFIKDAVDSVLAQKHHFSWEILIHDDASDDESTEIIADYCKQYPELIRLIRQEKRIGPFLSGKTLFENAKGKYITWLDADDYWTNPDKLQQQITFLENNSDYSGCFHDARIISTTDLAVDDQQMHEKTHKQYKLYSQFNHYQTDMYPWDLLERKIIPTASLVFRKGDMSYFFDKFSGFGLSVSWALQLYAIKNGKFRYFNEVWSVYRDHPQGLSKLVGTIQFKENNIAILRQLKRDGYYCSQKIHIYRAIAREYLQMMHNEKSLELSFCKRVGMARRFFCNTVLSACYEAGYFIRKK